MMLDPLLCPNVLRMYSPGGAQNRGLPGAELGQQGSEPGSQELYGSRGISSCSQGVHSYIPPTGIQGLAPAAAPEEQLLGLGLG